ncbi:MAG: cytochrome c3 family protein [Chloroflexi bacterium]|nr:cytochrome c3 family protein [Chloroflexota bacterium]
MPENNPERRIWIGMLIVLAVAILLAGGFLSQRSVRAQVDQPFPYSHRSHVSAGVECLYCHSDATRGPMATIPSMQKCMGCHQSIATEDPGVQQLTELWEHGKTIPWQRVNDQPDFVYFTHQPHLAAGESCETCHGNVSEMDTAQPYVEMDMGWCLDCHEQQPAEEVPHLWDCLVCHK